jgi:hypothetical protein
VTGTIARERCRRRSRQASNNGSRQEEHMAGFKVGYFVGSLATKSINRLLAKALVRAAPPELQLTEISFKELPLYSYDYDTNYPAVATAFKRNIAAVDAVLFVTTEYNRSIPGALRMRSTGRVGLTARTRSH